MRTFLRQHRYVIFVLLLMMVSIGVSVLFADEIRLLDRSALEALLAQAGIWAPLFLVAVVTVEVVIAPIPGGVPPVVAGALFGIEGLLYVWLGNVLGSSLAFWLARRFGVKLVRKIDATFDEQHYLSQVNKLWFFYFIPLMPVDILSFAFGLSRVRFRTFLGISALGFFFSMGLLTLFGDAIAEVLF